MNSKVWTQVNTLEKCIEIYGKTLLKCFYNRNVLWLKKILSCNFLAWLKVTYATISVKWINTLANPIIVTFSLAIACNIIITKSCNYIELTTYNRYLFIYQLSKGYNLTWTVISVVITRALTGTINSANSLPIAFGSGVARN